MRGESKSQVEGGASAFTINYCCSCLTGKFVQFDNNVKILWLNYMWIKGKYWNVLDIDMPKMYWYTNVWMFGICHQIVNQSFVYQIFWHIWLVSFYSPLSPHSSKHSSFLMNILHFHLINIKYVHMYIDKL